MTGRHDAYRAAERALPGLGERDADQIVDAVWPIIAAEVRRDTLNNAAHDLADRLNEEEAAHGYQGFCAGLEAAVQYLRDEVRYESV